MDTLKFNIKVKKITLLLILLAYYMQAICQARYFTATASYGSLQSIIENLKLMDIEKQHQYKKFTAANNNIIGQVQLHHFFRSNNYHVLIGYEINKRQIRFFNNAELDYTRKTFLLALERKVFYFPEGKKRLKIYGLVGVGCAVNSYSKYMMEFLKKKPTTITSISHISFLNVEWRLPHKLQLHFGTGFGYKGFISASIAKGF